MQKDRITLKESQDRRQLRINNLMTELREKKQECLDYRQTMVALSQAHKAATDQQTSTTPETAAELPVRSPRAETPVARPHVPDQEDGVPTKPRKKLLPDPEVLTDGKKPDYDTWEIKMRAKLRHESFQYNTEELCIDYIFSRCSGRAADILAVGLEPGLYMIATSEEAFETLGAQFRDRHREERARLDFTALQLKEGGDYHAFFTDFMHLAKRARITEDRFKQEFAMKLPRVLGIQVAGLERSNAITFTEYHEKVSEIAYYLEREKKLVKPTPALPRLEKKTFLSNNWRNRETTPAKKDVAPVPDQKRRLTVTPAPPTATTMRCHNCEKVGHFAVTVLSARTPKVAEVEPEDADQDEHEEEVESQEASSENESP